MLHKSSQGIHVVNQRGNWPAMSQTDITYTQDDDETGLPTTRR